MVPRHTNTISLVFLRMNNRQVSCHIFSWPACAIAQAIVKANPHWGVARSSHARFFVWFVASGNSALVHGSARQLLGAMNQTKPLK